MEFQKARGDERQGGARRLSQSPRRIPVGGGPGFQWLAEVPLTMIFLLVTVPKRALSHFRKTAQVGASSASPALFGSGCYLGSRCKIEPLRGDRPQNHCARDGADGSANGATSARDEPEGRMAISGSIVSRSAPSWRRLCCHVARWLDTRRFDRWRY